MIRQQLTILLVLFFLFSCKENEQPPAVKNSPPKDTIPKSKPDTSSNPYVIVDVSPMDMSYFPVKCYALLNAFGIIKLLFTFYKITDKIAHQYFRVIERQVCMGKIIYKKGLTG